jgi:hypothetical protein
MRQTAAERTSPTDQTKREWRVTVDVGRDVPDSHDRDVGPRPVVGS